MLFRSGQIKPVHCHVVTSDLEGAVVSNIERKEADAQRMAEGMVSHMHQFNEQDIRGTVRSNDEYNPQMDMILPSWLVAS